MILVVSGTSINKFNASFFIKYLEYLIKNERDWDYQHSSERRKTRKEIQEKYNNPNSISL